jgi:hypothetical protein
MLYGTVAHFLGPSLALTLGSLSASAVSGFILLRYPGLRNLDFKGLEPAPGQPLPPRMTPPMG